MLIEIEGSQAVAEAVAGASPDVVCAYPITPQTHIVEGVGRAVRSGALHAEFINVESEFAALSVLIGASAAGARTYTATASQGLLYMMEAVYNAGGLGLPIVMTLANRAVGAPINIWNDQSDAMAARDAGWIQLFAETNQDAVDLHIQAFRIAEMCSLPVMVCMDGFVLTHAVERIDLPSHEAIAGFLPRIAPRQLLSAGDPITIGAMVGPEAFTEVRFQAHEAMRSARTTIEEVKSEFLRTFGRDAGGLVSPYLMDDAETVVVGMGSILGTVKDVVDRRRERGERIGVLGVTTFRPFPDDALREALAGRKHVIVLERAFATGTGGILTNDIARALFHEDVHLATVVLGLGGRPVHEDGLDGIFVKLQYGKLPDFSFLDLHVDHAGGGTSRQELPVHHRGSPLSRRIAR